MTNFPTLYKKTSTGKIQMWEIESYGEGRPNHDDVGVICTTYGILGGKMQEAIETITVGKNIGKANETLPVEQAQLEAKAQWEKKLKNKGYVTSIEDAEAGKRDARVIGGVDPMLAHSFEKRGHDIVWPAYVQPKLDGHRCIAVIQDGVCTLWSRQRKSITGVPHIQRQLETMFSDPGATIILDGELYNHDYRDNFEELTSKIRQQTPKPGHEVVQYWIYDAIVPGHENESFKERTQTLNFVAGRKTMFGGSQIVIVPTEEVDDKDEMIAVFGAYIENGFEGLMVRNAAGKYVGKRSKDLQKVKMMQDAEYKVVDVTSGKGKMANGAIFVCETENGDTFTCVMKCSLDERERYLREKQEYIGKTLTVQFQKLSAEGKPIFPVALRFREDV